MMQAHLAPAQRYRTDYPSSYVLHAMLRPPSEWNPSPGLGRNDMIKGEWVLGRLLVVVAAVASYRIYMVQEDLAAAQIKIRSTFDQRGLGLLHSGGLFQFVRVFVLVV